MNGSPRAAAGGMVARLLTAPMGAALPDGSFRRLRPVTGRRRRPPSLRGRCPRSRRPESLHPRAGRLGPPTEETTMTTSTMNTSRAARMAAALVLPMALAVPGVAAADQGGDGAPPPEAGEEDFTRTVLTTGLSDPFEIIWGPDDQLWVTERTAGRVTKVDPATGEKTTILTIPASLGGTEPDPNEGEEPPPEETPENLLLTTPGEQDGLLGMVLHPELLQGGKKNQY